MYCEDIKPNKVILLQDIQKDKELERKICILVNNAYIQAQSSTNHKRNFMIEQDQKVKTIYLDDRITYDMIYSYKKAFLSMFQDEGLSPVFSERDFFDTEICLKINKVAAFDIELMNKDQKDQKMLSDVFDYGVWIRLYEWWNNAKKIPEFYSPSPLSRYTDPTGNVFENNFDYHLFARQTSIQELKHKHATLWGYIDLDEVITWDNQGARADQWGKKQRLQSQADSTDEVVYVWLCYITLNGVKYVTTIANWLTKIIKRDVIEAITKEEKDDRSLTPFPISLSYTTPNHYDPNWESYREKIKPVQVALTQLVNAIHSKQLRDAWHDIVFYDIDRVDNPADLLQRPDWWPVFIPTTQLSQWPVTMPVMERNDTSKTWEYIAQLQSRVENSTALTWVTRWQESAAGTLGETQIQLQKSSAMFSVDAKNLMIGERMFRCNIYYRHLKLNITKAKEKVVILTDTSTLIRLTKTELIGANDPYVKIVSKKEMIMKDQAMVANMMAMLPMIQQDPNTHPVSVKMFQRELMLRQGMDWNFIISVVRLDESERHAKMMQDIINAWEMPQALIIPGIDLPTLYLYISMAIDNKIKEKIIAYLTVKMVQEWVSKPQQPDQNWSMQGTANSMASQAMSSQIAQNKPSLPPQ